MSYKIAIYDTQNEAIEAIQALEQAGFAPTELTVIAKDREHSRLIESETDVHADEMQELTEARAASDEHGIEDPRVVAPVAATSGFGMSGFFAGGMVYPGASFVAAGAFLDDDTGMDSALSDLGVAGDDIEACRKAIEAGAFVVAADIGNANPDGGPDLSRSGTAEAAYRSSGASRIL